MRWAFWKRDPDIREEFVGYVSTFINSSQLVMQTLQKANQLGLQGKRVTVIERRNEIDPLATSIWLLYKKD